MYFDTHSLFGIIDGVKHSFSLYLLRRLKGFPDGTYQHKTAQYTSKEVSVQAEFGQVKLHSKISQMQWLHRPAGLASYHSSKNTRLGERETLRVRAFLSQVPGRQSPLNDAILPPSPGHVLVIYGAGAPGGLVVKPRNYELRSISQIRAPSRGLVLFVQKLTAESA